MFNIHEGSKVINHNDLSIVNINGENAVIDFNIYVVVSAKPDYGDYVEVRDIKSNKYVRIKRDCLVPVF